MAFAFRSARGVAQQVRTIAAEQVEKALATARDGAGAFDGRVHQLRRRCKKLRGLLRLVELGFDDFKTENAALRDAADLLGGARDARVMVETLDALVGGGEGMTAQSVAARQFLVERAESLADGAGHETTLARFAGIISEFGERTTDWRFDSSGFAVVGEGLERTYQRLAKRCAEAERQETAEALHDWRKQAKYHYHHVRLLTEAAPDVLGGRAKALERLGEQLGDHHNLAVLGATLAEQRQGLGDLAAIQDAIEARQHELAVEAFALGRQLVAETPAALRLRFAGYWRLLPEEA